MDDEFFSLRAPFDSLHYLLYMESYDTSYEASKLQVLNKLACLTYIASSEIFYSRSHGSKTSILLNYESFVVSDMNNISSDTLSNCKLVLYGACFTGEGRAGANNLVNKTYAKGVTSVIGFDKSVICEEVNMWSTAFFDALATGKTIEQACLAADDYVGKNWTHEITTNSWHIAGSKEQSLK